MATLAIGQYTISQVYDGTDGKDGAAGKSAVVALLSNESHTLTANSSGTISSYSGASTNITVFDGATDVTSKSTITKSESGVTGTLSGSSYSVTSVTNGVGGIVTFTIKYNGITITKTFSISVSKQGTKGDTGNAGVSVRSITLQYAISNDKNVAPTTGWQNTIPTRNAGQYLWVRDYIVYSDESAENVGERNVTGDIGDNGVSISTVTSYFAVSTSNTTTPVDGWQTTMPTRNKGEYLWRKDYIVFSNGNAEYTTAVVISGTDGKDGSKGDKGDPGTAGVGVASIVEQYYKSTSATSLSGGSWGTTYPGWENGKYIWTKSIITYTNSETNETTPKCVTGAKGATGPTGNGIKTVDVKYYLSTSSSSLSGGSWSTDAPTWVDGKYMWSKTITTYTNGNVVESVPACITGGKGATGPEGTSAKVVKVTPSAQVFKSTTGATGTFTPQYIYLYPTFQNLTYSKWQYSTDGTTWKDVTSGSNGLTIATYNSVVNSLRVERNSSLYTSTITNVSFRCIATDTKYYDTVSIVKIYDVTDLQIGGRNLQLYSKTLDTNAFSTMYTETLVPNGVITDGVLELPRYQNANLMYIDALPGEEFVFSIYVKSSENFSGHMFLIQEYSDPENRVTYEWISGNVTTEWQRFHCVYTVKNETTTLVNLSLRGTTAEITYFKLPKIEKGNILTDWTPAPEDVENRLDELGSTKTAEGNTVNVLSADSLISVQICGSIGAAGYTGTQTINIANAGVNIESITLPLGSIVMRRTTDASTRDTFERRELDGISQWCKIERVDSSGNALSVENVYPLTKLLETDSEVNDLANVLDKLDIYRVPAGTNTLSSSSQKVYFRVTYYPDTPDNNNIIKELNIFIDKIHKRNAQVKTTVDGVQIEAYNIETTLTTRMDTIDGGAEGDGLIQEIQSQMKTTTADIATLTTTSKTIEGKVTSLESKAEAVDGNIDKAKEEVISYTETLVTQTSDSWMLELQKLGGDNLVKNSVMMNGTNFWLQHLIEAYYESATPPDISNYDTSFGTPYWYCTETSSSYKEGTVYMYNGSTWIYSGKTRAEVVNMKNPFFYVKSVKTDDAQSKTNSGQLMQYDICNVIGTDGNVTNNNENRVTQTGLKSAETHIFNVTNIMDYKTTEEYLTYSFKIKNNIKTGQVYCGVAFINQPLSSSQEVIQSIYEPCTLITPDEDKDDITAEYTTLKMPKESDFVGVYTIAEFYRSDTVPTLDDVYEQGKFWMAGRDQTATINGTSMAITNGKIYYCRAVNNNGTMVLSITNVPFTYHKYWLCTSSTHTDYVAGKYYTGVNGISATTLDTNYKYIYQAGDGIGTLVYRSGDSWVPETKTYMLYDLNSDKIWTYRNIYGAYYRTTMNKTNIRFYGIYFIVAFYGGLLATAGTGSPTSSTTPTRGVYYIDNTYNSTNKKYIGKVWRPKYTYSLNEENQKVFKFNSWENTGISSNFALTQYLPSEFPIPYNIPPIGNFDISDIKVEYSSVPTRWTQHLSEVYGKNFLMDESGFSIISGLNKMNIDEDSIIATYETLKVFEITGDTTKLNKAQVNKLIIDPFEHYLQTINGVTYLICN